MDLADVAYLDTGTKLRTPVAAMPLPIGLHPTGFRVESPSPCKSSENGLERAAPMFTRAEKISRNAPRSSGYCSLQDIARCQRAGRSFVITASSQGHRDTPHARPPDGLRAIRNLHLYSMPAFNATTAPAAYPNRRRSSPRSARPLWQAAHRLQRAPDNPASMNAHRSPWFETSWLDSGRVLIVAFLSAQSCSFSIPSLLRSFEPNEPGSMPRH